MTDPTALEIQMRSAVLDDRFGQGLERKIAESIMSQPDVANAVKAKQAAGGSLLQILAIVEQYVLTFLSTGTIDWAGLIAAIEAVIVPADQFSGSE